MLADCLLTPVAAGHTQPERVSEREREGEDAINIACPPAIPLLHSSLVQPVLSLHCLASGYEGSDGNANGGRDERRERTTSYLTLE